jgi:hypothetical protein
MIRRTLLRLLMAAAIGLAAGTAPADPVDDIIAEIRDQGFEIVRVQETWLGRVRIVAQDESFRREVVIDPTTGEIRRDLLVPKRRGAAPPAEPQSGLGSSRDIGEIGEGPGADDPGWGGGWGNQDGAAEGAGRGEGDADAE